MSIDRIIILATHIVSDIEFIAKEIVIIEKGYILKNDIAENLLSEIKEMTWETKIKNIDVKKFLNLYSVSNISQTQSEYIIRIISKEKPLENAYLVKPNLNDYCIYCFEVK